MPEHDVDPSAGADLPTSTGEFRARPDISASTAEFRAFADGDGPGGEAEPPWAMRAPSRNVPRLAAIAAIVAGVAVVLIVIAVLVLKH
jgi:hypothetical protein